jgi:very-short-patch-repair endonuclease
MNEKYIIELYSQQSKSMQEIAEMLNTYPNKIRRILIKHGVKILTKSEAQFNALQKGRAKIPTAGKVRTKEEKLKISKKLHERWANLNEEEYQTCVDKAKERWANLSQSKKEEMASAAIEAIRKAGKEGSKLEKFLSDELRMLGHKIEIHKKNLLVNENLEIDMYFPEFKAIIEIDGPSHFLPIWGEEKLQKQIKADQNKTGLILSKGFIIIRVKNLSDSLSLIKQEELKHRILSILSDIKDKYPEKSKRYIEIEI